MKIRPIIETTIGIESSPRNILNPVAMMSMNPNTANGKERRGKKVFFIENSYLFLF